MSALADRPGFGAPRLGSPLPHLHSRGSHFAAGTSAFTRTGLTPAHICPRTGPIPDHICPRTRPTPAHICPGTGPTPAHICPRTGPLLPVAPARRLRRRPSTTLRQAFSDERHSRSRPRPAAAACPGVLGHCPGARTGGYSGYSVGRPRGAEAALVRPGHGWPSLSLSSSTGCVGCKANLIKNVGALARAPPTRLRRRSSVCVADGPDASAARDKKAARHLYTDAASPDR